jgi:hypothetical protein
MKSIGLCLLILGCTLPCGLASETELERMERRILATPAAESNLLYHIRLKLGGTDAVEERWKVSFEAASGADKERWALLLAMNASPPYIAPEIDRSKRWLEQAGEGVEAHSFRAVIASLENDLEGTLKYLDAAYKQQPSLRLLQQKRQTLIARDGAAFDDEADLAFWIEQWKRQTAQTILRLEIANRLTWLHSARNRRQEWIDALEKGFAEKPASNWVEACALAAASLDALRADESQAWIEKARAAGAPTALLLRAESELFSNSTGYSTVYPYFDHYGFPPEDSFAAINFVNVIAPARPMLTGKFVDYVEENAALILKDPLALLQLVERFEQSRNLEDGNLENAILKILKEHCQNAPDDLEARFVYGRLLELSQDAKEASAQALETFLHGALGKLGQPVRSQEELRSRSQAQTFSLRLPPQNIDEEKPAGPEPVKSAFAFPNYRVAPEAGEETEYPNSPYFTQEGVASTVGDLFLAGLFHLREADAVRFEPIYRRWLLEANPPLHVRLNFAIKTEGSTSPLGLTAEIVESVITSDTASEGDLIEVLRGRENGRAKPEQMRRAGERLVALDPANRPGADINYLWALMEWKQADEAKAMFATVRGHAQPGNEEDERLLWSCSRRLASVCKNKSLELPMPAFLERYNKPEDKDADFKRLVDYFKSTRTPLTEGANPALIVHSALPLGSFLFVRPGSLLPGQTKDVMFSWVMASIDPALSIYESSFAFHRESLVIDEVLTKERMTRLVEEVGEENRALSAVRAFYDGKLEPDEQLRRIEAVAARFPDDQKLKLTVAAKAMTGGHWQKAIDTAKSARIDGGEEKWIQQALLLVSSRELGDQETARAAAQALVPLTWAAESRKWLADECERLGLSEEAAELRATPEFLMGK